MTKQGDITKLRRFAQDLGIAATRLSEKASKVPLDGEASHRVGLAINELYTAEVNVEQQADDLEQES
jgi:hypothetical protein